MGGWISQQFGKRVILIASNFGSFLIWLALAFKIERVEFIILARFAMGICSAAASGCVGNVLSIYTVTKIFIEKIHRSQAHISQRQQIRNIERFWGPSSPQG